MELLTDLEKKLNPIDSSFSQKPPLRLAAVLIPIFVHNNSLLLTKRTKFVKHHPGQVAFPGGRYEESDEDLSVTVLRETEEEVGIEANNIQLKGRLKPMISTSRHYVYPFVGFVEGNPNVTLNPAEVQEYFFADLNHLLDPKTLKKGFFKGKVRKYYSVYNYKIWGLTQMILSNFLSILSEN